MQLLQQYGSLQELLLRGLLWLRRLDVGAHSGRISIFWPGIPSRKKPANFKLAQKYGVKTAYHKAELLYPTTELVRAVNMGNSDREMAVEGPDMYSSVDLFNTVRYAMQEGMADIGGNR